MFSTTEPWDAISAAFDTYGMPLRVLIIIVVAVIIRWILIVILNRAVRQVTTGAKKRRERVREAEADGKQPPKDFPLSPLAAERIVQRTRALGSISRNLITALILVTTLIIILGEIGINVTAILASAGIIAAGLAFGAQNIVKDLLNGIFMVFEDQLGVGDSVIIGDIDGTVEVVGIRITQVRSYDGTLWFIRNGEILKVGNMSHGWGRAVLDVSIDADTDLNQAHEIIFSAANAAVRESDIARLVTAVPQIIGLQQVSEDRATVRVAVKTAPDAQAEVIRALRTHIKSAFDAAGIKFAPDVPTSFLKSISDTDGE
jgi:small-conductance mechanosensitive channel